MSGNNPAGSSYAGSMGNETFIEGSTIPTDTIFPIAGAPGTMTTGAIWHGHCMATVAQAQAQAGVGSGTFAPCGDDTAGLSAHFSGIFSHCNWACTIADITDGTSNTIAIGEIRPLCANHPRDGWMHDNSLWVATTYPINYPTTFCPCSSGFNVPPGEDGWGSDQAFRSAHPHGCTFVFCDGSTHFLSENIDYVTYQRLGDRHDGGTPGAY